MAVRGVLKQFLLFFLPAALLVAAAFMLLHLSQAGVELRVLEARELEIVAAQKAAILAEISTIRADLLILAEPPVAPVDEASRLRLEERFLAFARYRGVYDQIRFIGARGNEIVRVNHNAGLTSVVPLARLQDKSDRYYFQDAMRVRPGEIYMSPFDLNAEQSSLEVPFKPTIRMAAPVPDGSGRTAGMVVINYLGETMLRRLKLASEKAPGEVMLLNREGYWLAALDPNDEWGFMIRERENRTIGRRFPEASRRIYEARTGQFGHSDGLFTFDTIFPLLEGGVAAAGAPGVQGSDRTASYLWKIVSRVPRETIARVDADRLSRSAPLYLAVLLVLGIGSWGLAREVVRRKGQEREVRESEARRRRLLESIRDAYFEMGADGRLIEVSAAAEHVFGYPPDRMVGRTLGELGAGEKLLSELAEHGSVADLQIAVRAPDGSLRQCSVNAWKVGSPAGPWRFVGTAREITERLRLEEHLRQSQRLESVGRLAGGIAHDFNNLLTAVIGYADLILTSDEATTEVRESAGEIRKSAERAASLTRQLLAFSRRQVMQPRIVDLNQLVTEMVRMLDRIIGEHVRLLIRKGPRLAQINADPSQIEQVIVNLTINAAEAMASGGTLTIETTNVFVDELYGQTHAGMQPGTYVCLTVVDTGHGMDRETLEHIFEPFFTTKEVGKGSGLGLATVYGIVKQTGGYIWVDSEPGKGTTFRIYFPPAQGFVEAPAQVPPPVAARRGSERILLVEDDPVLRRMTLEALRRLGYAVASAADAAEALAIVDGGSRFDLVVTDVVMPGMNGRDLAERLVDRLPGCRVLFVSGYAGDTIVLRGVLEDATSFLQKPYSLAELTGRIRALFGEDSESQLSLPL